MARSSDLDVLARWMTEVGRSEPHFLRTGQTLFVNDRGVLFFDPTGKGRRNATRSETLARFLGQRYTKHGFALLNGDGFDGAHARDATAWQTRVRERAHTTFTWQRCPIIPYEALDGAGIDHDTIRVITVTEETNEQRINQLPGSFNPHNPFPTPGEIAIVGFKRTDSESYNADAAVQVWEGELQGLRTRIQFSRRAGETNVWNRTYWIWAQPEFGQPAWQVLRHHDTEYIRGKTTPIYAWTENVHRLGASLFTAQYIGGKSRHRFISDFDMQEPGGLYYLAQLPGKGKCETYEDAMHLLAPPIVHKAREQGKAVYRQGDVFAVEITQNDDWVYEDAEFVVRRSVVLANHELTMRSGQKLTENAIPRPHEVQEPGTCPFCNCRPKVGTGPKARRALMIHGTGHTASEVVVKKDGRTFIRGIMHHDPELDTPGREPEHRVVNLDVAGRPESWFLALRNTVPRVRNAPQQVTEPAEETRPGQDAIADNIRYEAERQAASQALEQQVA